MVIMIKDKSDMLELLSDIIGAETLLQEMVEILPDTDCVAAMKYVAKKYDVDLNGVQDFMYIDDQS